MWSGALGTTPIICRQLVYLLIWEEYVSYDSIISYLVVLNHWVLPYVDSGNDNLKREKVSHHPIVPSTRMEAKNKILYAYLWYCSRKIPSRKIPWLFGSYHISLIWIMIHIIQSTLTLIVSRVSLTRIRFPTIGPSLCTFCEILRSSLHTGANNRTVQ